MTDEIIKAIAEAEEQAAQMKAAAEEHAAKTLQTATENVSLKEKTSAEVCKAYRETQIRQAHADAEAAYVRAMEKAKIDAKNYCESVLQTAESAVAEIVGRITCGDC